MQTKRRTSRCFAYLACCRFFHPCQTGCHRSRWSPGEGARNSSAASPEKRDRGRKEALTASAFTKDACTTVVRCSFEKHVKRLKVKHWPEPRNGTKWPSRVRRTCLLLYLQASQAADASSPEQLAEVIRFTVWQCVALWGLHELPGPATSSEGRWSSGQARGRGGLARSVLLCRTANRGPGSAGGRRQCRGAQGP